MQKLSDFENPESIDKGRIVVVGGIEYVMPELDTNLPEIDENSRLLDKYKQQKVVTVFEIEKYKQLAESNKIRMLVFNKNREYVTIVFTSNHPILFQRFLEQLNT